MQSVCSAIPALLTAEQSLMSAAAVAAAAAESDGDEMLDLRPPVS